ncbi:MAG: hypothetical protein J6V66_05470 [Clostridia bacterium]|nr:hypothetical protein [Clostridia bacterium]
MTKNQEKLLMLHVLYLQFDDMLVDKFFDFESEKMLDEKLEVFTALANGVKPIDIPNYYKVLELYPKDGVIFD